MCNKCYTYYCKARKCQVQVIVCDPRPTQEYCIEEPECPEYNYLEPYEHELRTSTLVTYDPNRGRYPHCQPQCPPQCPPQTQPYPYYPSYCQPQCPPPCPPPTPPVPRWVYYENTTTVLPAQTITPLAPNSGPVVVADGTIFPPVAGTITLVTGWGAAPLTNFGGVGLTPFGTFSIPKTAPYTINAVVNLGPFVASVAPATAVTATVQIYRVTALNNMMYLLAVQQETVPITYAGNIRLQVQAQKYLNAGDQIFVAVTQDSNGSATVTLNPGSTISISTLPHARVICPTTV